MYRFVIHRLVEGESEARLSFGSPSFYSPAFGFFCGSAWVVLKGSFSKRGPKASKNLMLLPQMEIWEKYISPIIKRKAVLRASKISQIPPLRVNMRQIERVIFLRSASLRKGAYFPYSQKL